MSSFSTLYIDKKSVFFRKIWHWNLDLCGVVGLHYNCVLNLIEAIYKGPFVLIKKIFSFNPTFFSFGGNWKSSVNRKQFFCFHFIEKVKKKLPSSIGFVKILISDTMVFNVSDEVARQVDMKGLVLALLPSSLENRHRLDDYRYSYCCSMCFLMLCTDFYPGFYVTFFIFLTFL